MDRTCVGLIGCGVISNTYLRDMKRLYADSLYIKMTADVDSGRAKKQAEAYGVEKNGTVEELLSDPEITLVINLTPPRFHTPVNRQIIEAGKHVFCEKPFALSMEEAIETAELAAKKGVMICCAPDSFLGSSLSTCRKVIQDGWIGKPLYVNANMMNSGVETWHPSPAPFYSEGGGPVFDMGGYYFTALVSMFGAAKQVMAVQETGYKERTCYTGPEKGKKVPVQTPTFYALILTMKSGVIVTMNFSFDIWKSTLPMFEVYGTDGTLMVPDPNMHGGIPKIYRKEQKLSACFDGMDTGSGEAFALPELNQNVGEYVRGIGVADMAEAIKAGTRPGCNIDLVLHVTEIMTGTMEAAKSGEIYRFKTTYV